MTDTSIPTPFNKRDIRDPRDIRPGERVYDQTDHSVFNIIGECNTHDLIYRVLTPQEVRHLIVGDRVIDVRDGAPLELITGTDNGLYLQDKEGFYRCDLYEAQDHEITSTFALVHLSPRVAPVLPLSLNAAGTVYDAEGNLFLSDLSSFSTGPFDSDTVTEMIVEAINNYYWSSQTTEVDADKGNQKALTLDELLELLEPCEDEWAVTTRNRAGVSSVVDMSPTHATLCTQTNATRISVKSLKEIMEGIKRNSTSRESTHVFYEDSIGRIHKVTGVTVKSLERHSHSTVYLETSIVSS